MKRKILSVAIQFTQNFLGVEPEGGQVCKFVKDFRSDLLGVRTARIEVPCKLVEVGAHPAALGKQGGSRFVEMTENYRSARHVVAAANDFVKGIGGRLKSMPIVSMRKEVLFYYQIINNKVLSLHGVLTHVKLQQLFNCIRFTQRNQF